MNLKYEEFMSRGYALSFDEGFICKDMSVTFNPTPSRPEPCVMNALTAFHIMYQSHARLLNYTLFAELENLGIEITQNDVMEMLKCLLAGKAFREKIRANKVRIGMCEFQLGLQYFDEAENDWSYKPMYLVLPIEHADCEITFVDKDEPDFVVKATWKNGKLTSVN